MRIKGAILKFKGQTVANTNVEHVLIPRLPEPIHFIAKPVLSLKEFEELCPEPKPPIKTYPEETGKKPEPDYDDADYGKKLTDYYTTRYYWMCITSLKDSPDIEWDTVDILKPETYNNFEKELQDAGFMPLEINAITTAVAAVNALDERQLERARANFLASQQAQDK